MQVLSYVPHPAVEPPLHFFANAFCSYFCLNYPLCLEQCPHSFDTPRRLSQKVASTYPKIAERMPLAGCFTAFFCAFFFEMVEIEPTWNGKAMTTLVYQSSFVGIWMDVVLRCPFQGWSCESKSFNSLTTQSKLCLTRSSFPTALVQSGPKSWNPLDRVDSRTKCVPFFGTSPFGSASKPPTR